MENINQLATEQINPRTIHIDEMSTADMIRAINREDQTVAESVAACIDPIAALTDQIAARLQKGGRLFYIGAGTSGRLGILDASECPPTFGVSPELVQGVIAGGFSAMKKAKEGSEDSLTLAAEDLAALHLSADDVVIGIAASGRTPYVIGGIEYANHIGAFTGCICNVKPSKIGKLVKIAIDCPVGPEVVTGSTRMKSGTAQKMILNMLSTAAMIKLGKTYQNLMVDVQCTNGKLIERARHIIMNATGCDYDRAAAVLTESGNDVKCSIIMILSSVTKEKALATLQKNQGNVSKTIHQLTDRTAG